MSTIRFIKFRINSLKKEEVKLRKSYMNATSIGERSRYNYRISKTIDAIKFNTELLKSLEGDNDTGIIKKNYRNV